MPKGKIPSKVAKKQTPQQQPTKTLSALEQQYAARYGNVPLPKVAAAPMPTVRSTQPPRVVTPPLSSSQIQMNPNIVAQMGRPAAPVLSSSQIQFRPQIVAQQMRAQMAGPVPGFVQARTQQQQAIQQAATQRAQGMNEIARMYQNVPQGVNTNYAQTQYAPQSQPQTFAQMAQSYAGPQQRGVSPQYTAPGQRTRGATPTSQPQTFAQMARANAGPQQRGVSPLVLAATRNRPELLAAQPQGFFGAALATPSATAPQTQPDPGNLPGLGQVASVRGNLADVSRLTGQAFQMYAQTGDPKFRPATMTSEIANQLPFWSGEGYSSPDAWLRAAGYEEVNPGQWARLDPVSGPNGTTTRVQGGEGYGLGGITRGGYDEPFSYGGGGGGGWGYGDGYSGGYGRGGGSADTMLVNWRIGL